MLPQNRFRYFNPSAPSARIMPELPTNSAEEPYLLSTGKAYCPMYCENRVAKEGGILCSYELTTVVFKDTANSSLLGNTHIYHTASGTSKSIPQALSLYPQDPG